MIDLENNAISSGPAAVGAFKAVALEDPEPLLEPADWFGDRRAGAFVGSPGVDAARVRAKALVHRAGELGSAPSADMLVHRGFGRVGLAVFEGAHGVSVTVRSYSIGETRCNDNAYQREYMRKRRGHPAGA